MDHGQTAPGTAGRAAGSARVLLMSAMLAAVGVLMLAAGAMLARRGSRRLAEARRRDDGAAMPPPRFPAGVLDLVQDGVVVCDAAGRILAVNEPAARLFGRKPETLAGDDLQALVDPPIVDLEGVLKPEGHTRLRSASGEAVAVAFSSCLVNAPQEPPRWALVLRNLSDEQQAQKRIRYLARFDTLTRMPNRMEFQHRLQQAMSRARRGRTRAALLYVDIDRFKDVNDRFGHPVGDRALEILSGRMIEAMEPRTLAGRLGGDEFAILVEGLPLEDDPRPALAATARMLLDRLGRKFHVEGFELMLTASIGVAIYPEDADNVIDIIRNGDAAMYHAKQNGGNTYGFYAPQMNADAVEMLLLKSDLRSAIERGEFQLRYQPKVDLRDGRIAGCEALLRWRHSRRGDIPPSLFIPLAEQSSLIFDIGTWVLKQVCTDFKAWQTKVPWPGRVAVNLSLRQLRQRDFVNEVEKIFRAHELNPSCVELEITESTLADHGEQTLRTLDRLYQLGLHLSIDDFGTGYSSLSSLQHFPIGTLKIDHGFIRDATMQRSSEAIVGAIVGLGRSLDMDVVAEGIETATQLAMVQRVGCTLGQGHLFGEPLTGERYLAMLVAQQEGEAPHGALLASRMPGQA